MRNWKIRNVNVNVKKISAEQKLHFHRLWDVSEEKPGVRQAWAGILALPKTHCMSLGLVYPVLKTGVCVN